MIAPRTAGQLVVTRYSRVHLDAHGREREIAIIDGDRGPAVRVARWRHGMDDGCVFVIGVHAARALAVVAAAQAGREAVEYLLLPLRRHVRAYTLRSPDGALGVELTYSAACQKTRRREHGPRPAPVPIVGAELDGLEKALRALEILASDTAA